VVAALVSVVAAASVAGSGHAEASLEDSRLSLRAVYARVERAVHRDGRVYHQTNNATSSGAFSGSDSVETWIPADADTLRQQFPNAPFARLVSGGVDYGKNESAPLGQIPAQRCYGASAAISTLLGCPLRSGPMQSQQKVLSGTWHGTRVVVLVTKFNGKRGTTGVAHGESRVYLDAKTFRPVASEALTVQGTGKDRRRTLAHGSYVSSFDALDSLPPDFFTPSAIESWVASQ
jgi:hypothetical protein